MSTTSIETHYSHQVMRTLDTMDSNIAAVKLESTKEHTRVGIPENVKLKMLTERIKRPVVNIEFHDLVHRVDTMTEKKIILDNISGVFESGKLSAIMGPSGAGKTTLMDILMGLVTSQVRGTILTNGRLRNHHNFNKLTGYIMQEDLLRPHLSVEESMLVVADLKLGNQFSKSEKMEVINEIIECMGLENCRFTRTNNLSGGQRKRTSIALELVYNPSVLFLDEPTSGLDTVASRKCLGLLKSLSMQGRTIVCTLHQPSSSLFYLLDHVYFMANGRCIFQGLPSQVVPFLMRVGLSCKSTYNPADYILEILIDQKKDILSQEIQNGKIVQGDSSQRCLTLKGRNFDTVVTDDDLRKFSPQFSLGPVAQFLILYKRKMTIQIRDRTGLWLLLGHHLFCAVMSGLLFYGIGNDGTRSMDNIKLGLSLVTYFAYTYSIIPTIASSEEMKFLKREYFNQWYSLKAYNMMSVLAPIPVIIIYGTLYIAIVYLMTNQPLEWYRFLIVGFAIFMNAIISDAWGTIIGSSLRNTTANAATAILTGINIALCCYGFGYATQIKPIIYNLLSISYVRCTIALFFLSLYNERADMNCPQDENEIYICLIYKDPKVTLRVVGMSDYSVLNQIIVLIFSYLLVRVLLYYSLKFRVDKDLSMKMISFVNKLLRREHIKQSG